MKSSELNLGGSSGVDDGFLIGLLFWLFFSAWGLEAPALMDSSLGGMEV